MQAPAPEPYFSPEESAEPTGSAEVRPFLPRLPARHLAGSFFFAFDEIRAIACRVAGHEIRAIAGRISGDKIAGPLRPGVLRIPGKLGICRNAGEDSEGYKDNLTHHLFLVGGL